jgi:hypothetical protein
MASPITSLANFGRHLDTNGKIIRSDDLAVGVPREETYYNSGSGSDVQVIINHTVGSKDQILAQDDGSNGINASGTVAAAAPAGFSLGQKRPALTHIPAPNPIRQHLESAQNTSIEPLNSLGTYRGRVVGLVTSIQQTNFDVESNQCRLDARITNLESTRHIVQNNEISVFTINSPVAHTQEKTVLVPQRNQHPTTNKIYLDNDTAEARKILNEMQISQQEIKYATMETHFKTQLAFALAQKEESQRAAASLQYIAGAALDEAKQCRAELAALKEHMYTAHVVLLKEVAAMIHNLKKEVDSLKDDHEELAANALVAPRPAPPEASCTSDEPQPSGE